MSTTTPPIIELTQNAGNAPTSLDPLQTMLAPHTDLIVSFWLAVWVITGIVLLIKLWHEYKEQKR